MLASVWPEGEHQILGLNWEIAQCSVRIQNEGLWPRQSCVLSETPEQALESS